MKFWKVYKEGHLWRAILCRALSKFRILNLYDTRNLSKFTVSSLNEVRALLKTYGSESVQIKATGTFWRLESIQRRIFVKITAFW